MTNTIEVLDPTGLPPRVEGDESSELAPRIASLESVPLGFLDNLKPGGSHLLGGVRRHLSTVTANETHYWAKTGPQGSSGPMENGEKIAAQVGAVINALGD